MPRARTIWSTHRTAPAWPWAARGWRCVEKAGRWQPGDSASAMARYGRYVCLGALKILLESQASSRGEVAEWSNVPDSKSGVVATSPWVRIPPSPPVSKQTSASRGAFLFFSPLFSPMKKCLKHPFLGTSDTQTWIAQAATPMSKVACTGTTEFRQSPLKPRIARVTPCLARLLSQCHQKSGVMPIAKSSCEVYSFTTE